MAESEQEGREGISEEDRRTPSLPLGCGLASRNSMGRKLPMTGVRRLMRVSMICVALVAGLVLCLQFIIVAGIWVFYECGWLPPEAYAQAQVEEGITKAEVVDLLGEPTEAYGPSRLTPISDAFSGYEHPPVEWPIEHELLIYPYFMGCVGYIYVGPDGRVTRVWVGGS